ncbi:hypothetical protein N431DRAFT_110167 [Stipitochalara longipes BDJ]|nr:hypothetical protein N431DRAFT_110167 [Stipitochalara longipes BDJ]
MKITAVIALAILAHGAVAVAVPLQSSSPSEKNSREIQKHQIEDLPPISTIVTSEGIIEIAPIYPVETTSTGLPFDSHPDNLENFPTTVDDIAGDDPKNQTNTAVSARHRYQPKSHSAQGGYNYTEIEALFNEMLSEYEYEGKNLKRSIPRLDVVDKALQRLKAYNSTNPSDDEKAQLIIDQLGSDLTQYRRNGYKYTSPQLEVAAIHKAEDRLRRLNVTRDASLIHGEKLRDYCYQIDGSHHRQESCAREAKQKVAVAALHSQPSWNSTAVLGKRDVKKVMPDIVSAGSKLERRQDDPTPDPAWLDKFLFPEKDNSLPKRNEKRWEFEGSLNMEYEDPKSHETTDVDMEASWFSDWKRSLAESDEGCPISCIDSSVQQAVKWNLADQVRKLENDIETKIAKPFIEFKNATEDATDAIQNAVERFTASVHKHKSHSPGKLNVTATFDPSKLRKRGLPESVRNLENEIGSKITKPFNKLAEPFAKLKNSTECSQSGSYSKPRSSIEPRMHAKDIKRPHGDLGNCQKYGSQTPNQEFSHENGRKLFHHQSQMQKEKHQYEALMPEGEHWVTEEEQTELYAQIRKELKDVEFPSRKARL